MAVILSLYVEKVIAMMRKCTVILIIMMTFLKNLMSA